MLDQRVGPQLEGRDRQILDHVASAAVRLDDMLAGMIRHARLLKHQPTIEVTDLGALARRVVDARLASTWRDRLPEGTEVEVVVADDLDAVATDATLVTQVVEELLDNALTYRDPERPNAVQVTADRDGADVVLSVSDTGSGMRHDYLDRAVKLFGRLVTESEHPGTGIGLSVVDVAVAHLGGTLQHADNEPHGAVFTVRLPDTQAGGAS